MNQAFRVSVRATEEKFTATTSFAFAARTEIPTPVGNPVGQTVDCLSQKLVKYVAGTDAIVTNFGGELVITKVELPPGVYTFCYTIKSGTTWVGAIQPLVVNGVASATPQYALPAIRVPFLVQIKGANLSTADEYSFARIDFEATKESACLNSKYNIPTAALLGPGNLYSPPTFATVNVTINLGGTYVFCYKQSVVKSIAIVNITTPGLAVGLTIVAYDPNTNNIGIAGRPTAEKERQTALQIWISIVAIVVFLLMVIIVAVICCKNKNKCCFKSDSKNIVNVASADDIPMQDMQTPHADNLDSSDLKPSKANKSPTYNNGSGVTEGSTQTPGHSPTVNPLMGMQPVYMANQGTIFMNHAAGRPMYHSPPPLLFNDMHYTNSNERFLVPYAHIDGEVL